MVKNVNSRKGQAALDFLMTYGWALLIIVLIVGALFALGIFDIGTFLGSRSSGFAQIAPSAWRITDSGNLTMIFKNNAGTSVNITNINATLGNTQEVISYTTNFALPIGTESGTVNIGGFSDSPSHGSSYSVKVEIQYIDTSTGFTYLDAGTITGKVA